MKKFFYLFVFLSIFSCESPINKLLNNVEVVIRGEAQGTTFTIKYIIEGEFEVDSLSKIAEDQGVIEEEIDSLLKAVDLSMSTYIPSSTITHLNHGDTVKIDEMFQHVFQLSKEVHELTSGAFNPTIGPLIKAWGFDFSKPTNMDSSEVNDLLKSSGFEQFQMQGNEMWKLNEKARINFNAIAQGYSVDLMTEVLNKKGFKNYYVELGGELITKGRNKSGEWWVIGIDKPKDNNLDRELAARVSLQNAAMATSGNYRKFYEVDGKRYSHTLNPNTGYPAENNLLSATVVANTAAYADALATSFMVMGLEKTKSFLSAQEDVQAYLIFSNENNEFETYATEKFKESILED